MVTFPADVDLATEGALRRALDLPWDEDPELTVLVLDLGGDGFCSVRGLALLADATRSFADHGVELVVARPRPVMLRMLRLLQLENRLRLVPDVPDGR